MLPEFAYLRVRTVEEALAALGYPGAVLLAGGTDLIPALRRGTLRPRLLVDVSGVEELQSIGESGGGLVIGAGVTFARLAADPLVVRRAAALAEAAASVGGPQIRNRATLGGNVANGAPAADSVPALLVLAARVQICSRTGAREVAVADLVRDGLVGLRPGEIITRFFIPGPAGGEWASAFAKLGLRRSMAIARLSLAAALRPGRREGAVEELRLAVGAAGPSPYRCGRAEEKLSGNELCPATARLVAEAVGEEVAGRLGARPSAPYKREAVKGLVWDVLERLARKSWGDAWWRRTFG